MPLQIQDAALARFDDEPRIEVEVEAEEMVTAEELCPPGLGPSVVLETIALTQTWDGLPEAEAVGVKGIPAEEEELGFGAMGSAQFGLVDVVVLPV